MIHVGNGLSPPPIRVPACRAGRPHGTPGKVTAGEPVVGCGRRLHLGITRLKVHGEMLRSATPVVAGAESSSLAVYSKPTSTQATTSALPIASLSAHLLRLEIETVGAWRKFGDGTGSTRQRRLVGGDARVVTGCESYVPGSASDAAPIFLGLGSGPRGRLGFAKLSDAEVGQAAPPGSQSPTSYTTSVVA